MFINNTTDYKYHVWFIRKRILMYNTFHNEILTRAINKESKRFVLIFNFEEFNKIGKEY